MTLSISNRTKGLVFLVLFKTLIILLYLIVKDFTNNFIFFYELILLLSGFDFWVTKNLVGR